MLQISSETRRFGIKYTPLDVSCAIVPYGGVPARQVYNSRDGGFIPDYTSATPACLFPKCNVSDPSKPVVTEYINDDLNSIAWYELKYNESQKKYVRGNKISTGTDYQVVEETSDGLVKGMLIVKKNASTNAPLKLEFEAYYTNAKTRQIVHFIGQFSIFCDDTEKPMPILHVSPRVMKWNPLIDAKNVTFEATLTDGENDVTNSKNTRFYWYRKTNIKDGKYSLEIITGSASKDFDVVEIASKSAMVDGKETSVHGNKLTINSDLVGDAEYYVCRALYRVEGLQSSTPFGETDPQEELAIIRSMPNYSVSYECVGDSDDEDISSIYPVAKVMYRNTPIENPEEFFDLVWFRKLPTESGFTQVATGASPEITFVDGMQLYVTAKDKGANKLLADDSGNLIVDDNGAYIYDK